MAAWSDRCARRGCSPRCGARWWPGARPPRGPVAGAVRAGVAPRARRGLEARPPGGPGRRAAPRRARGPPPGSRRAAPRRRRPGLCRRLGAPAGGERRLGRDAPRAPQGGDAPGPAPHALPGWSPRAAPRAVAPLPGRPPHARAGPRPAPRPRGALAGGRRDPARRRRRSLPTPASGRGRGVAGHPPAADAALVAALLAPRPPQGAAVRCWPCLRPAEPAAPALTRAVGRGGRPGASARPLAVQAVRPRCRAGGYGRGRAHQGGGTSHGCRRSVPIAYGPI